MTVHTLKLKRHSVQNIWIAVVVIVNSNTIAIISGIPIIIISFARISIIIAITHHDQNHHHQPHNPGNKASIKTRVLEAELKWSP